MTTDIKYKVINYQKEGLIDAAARLGIEADLFAEKHEIKKARECYLTASMLINEEIAYYK